MPDAIVVKCDACGKQFKASADLAGKMARCPCGQVISVPEASGEDLARKWYYAKDGQRFGPVPQSEIKRLVDGGELTKEDYAWTQGMAEWLPSGQVEELTELFGGQAQAVEGGLQALKPEAAASTTSSPPTTPRQQPAAQAAASAPAESKAETLKTTVAPKPAAGKKPATQEIKAPAPRAAESRAPRTSTHFRHPEAAPAYAFVRIVSLVFMVVGLLFIGFGVALVVLGLMDGRSDFLYGSGVCVLSGVILLCVSQLLAIARDIGIRMWQVREMAREMVGILTEIIEQGD